MLDICLVGTGGMMPLHYRYLTALMLRFNGRQLLIDCGEATQMSLRKRGWSFKPIDTICLTHYHGDHVAGLPGILLSMANAERTEPLTLIGPRGLEKVVNALRVIAPELPFELKFIELSGRWSMCSRANTRSRHSVCIIPSPATATPWRSRARDVFRWKRRRSWDFP